MSHSQAPQGQDPAEYSPTAWFAVLERARLTGDKQREAVAIERLLKLGVRVEFVGEASK